MTRVAVGFLIALAIGMIPRGAEAAVGDILKNLFIPPAAQCAEFEGSSGTAVAVVPGGKAGFPKVPSLLVTNCNLNGSATLFFLATPSPASESSTAILVGTLPLSVELNRFDSLALRADTGDLLGCFEDEAGTSLYAIHFSPFDTAGEQGTTNFLTAGPAGSSCDGVSWDPIDKSVYQSGGFSNTVLKYSLSNSSAVTSIPVGCTDGFANGVEVVGASLFVACPHGDSSTTPEIRQLDKTNGNLVTQQVTPAVLKEGRYSLGDTINPRDIQHDPVTFKPRDAVWSKSSLGNNRLVAIEVPAGAGGQRTGPPVLFPGACFLADGTPDTTDSDGDGLLDCWEDGARWADGLPGISFTGIYDGNPAHRDITLCVDADGNGTFGPGECAHPRVKDVFLEIDFMEFHRPNQAAVNNVVQAYLNAPTLNVPPVTTTTPATGIRLHVQIDEQLTHAARIALPPCTGSQGPGDVLFDDLKRDHFGTVPQQGNANARNAKRLAFHYAIFAHDQSGSTASGCAEVPGNDFLITLGSFKTATVANHTGFVGTLDQQGGTLMHELGHNLGLRHGGIDNTNCKPNYPSVMNYGYQFSTPVTGRILDYSRRALGVPINTPTGPIIGLDESSLSETAGVGGFTGQIAFGPPAGIPLARPTTATATGAINWNRAGAADQTVSSDINNWGIAGCPASFPGVKDILEGFDDWSNIQLNFRSSIDFADGSYATLEPAESEGTGEITFEELVGISPDSDGDGIVDAEDNCPNTPNADQADANGNGVGDACSLKVKVLGLLVDARLPRILGVAIMGAPGRDVTKIDRSTIVLHGGQVNGNGTWLLKVKLTAAGVPRCIVKDINFDRRLDLVCDMEVSQGQLPAGASNVILEATTVPSATPPAEHLQGFATIHVIRLGDIDIIAGL